jgi:hypothetical protein
MDALLRVLRTVDEHRFYMNAWVIKPTDQDGFTAEGRCGFAGCAIGHACQDPYFQALGLHLREILGMPQPLFIDGDGHARVGFNAAACMLDISVEVAECLFDPNAYIHIEPGIEFGTDIQPKHVIARIEEVMRADAERKGGQHGQI